MTRNDDGGIRESAAEWIPPPPDEREEHEYDSAVGDPGDILHFRQCWDPGGRMADFAIIQMSPLGGRQQRVAYADIRHGELHVHILNQQGAEIGHESLRLVVTQKDVEEAYDMALDRFVEKWEEYKRRWRRG
jgi:hypothetical protein